MALTVRSLKPQLAPQPDRIINALLTAGVWTPADSFEVTAPGGMFVQVGSGTEGDKAVVEGSASRQGVYIVENPDGTYDAGGGSDVAIAAGDASDDRIDLIVLRVYDDAMDSSGQTEALVEVVEGTPASTPAAPSLPDSAIALAEVTVSAGESTAITSGDITDVRDRTGLDLLGAWNMPRGELGYAQRTTDFNNVDSTPVLAGMTTTVDVAADRSIKVTGHIRVSSVPDNGLVTIAVEEDGTQVGVIALNRFAKPSGLLAYVASGSVRLAPAAGEHTYELRTSVDTGSMNISADSDRPAFILVEDIGPA